MIKQILVLIVFSLSLGCAVPQQYMRQQYQYPRNSESADILFNLDSNIEKTAFIVDGKQIAIGRRVKIMLDDKEHTITAKPVGYISKEEFLQPPFRDGQSLSFTFMLGDRIEADSAFEQRNNRDTTLGKRRDITSDVDQIPQLATRKRQNDFAIVIGVEEYRQHLPSADYARHDAEIVTEYLTKIMGFQEENVVTLVNERAAKSDFEKYFEKWLYNNVDKNSTVFVYFSGHGAPNPQNGDAYLVPYDGDPAFIDQTGYSLKRLYDSLSKLQAKTVIVALDSCFSGSGGKSVMAAGSRSLVRKEKVQTKNLVVLTASEDSQSSSTYDEKGHGLFTYFMLKKIKETVDKNEHASLQLGDLYNYIKPQVEKTARKLKNNEQTPQLVTPNIELRNLRLF